LCLIIRLSFFNKNEFKKLKESLTSSRRHTEQWRVSFLKKEEAFVTFLHRRRRRHAIKRRRVQRCRVPRVPCSRETRKRRDVTQSHYVPPRPKPRLLFFFSFSLRRSFFFLSSSTVAPEAQPRKEAMKPP